jgi:putative component of toxin-antitoxin plasmid stabilization module
MKYQIHPTDAFENWLAKQNPKTKNKILMGLSALQVGHFGARKKVAQSIELSFLGGTCIYLYVWENSIIVESKPSEKRKRSLLPNFDLH